MRKLVVGILLVLTVFFSSTAAWAAIAYSVEKSPQQILVEQAAAGNADAQVEVGITIYNNKAYEKAAEMFQSAANQGHPAGQTMLGVMYYSNQGVKQDYKKAAEFFQLAASQGFAHGQNMLGVTYYNVRFSIFSTINLVRPFSSSGDRACA
jgi:TPR repeat protein